MTIRSITRSRRAHRRLIATTSLAAILVPTSPTTIAHALSVLPPPTSLATTGMRFSSTTTSSSSSSSLHYRNDPDEMMRGIFDDDDDDDMWHPAAEYYLDVYDDDDDDDDDVIDPLSRELLRRDHSHDAILATFATALFPNGIELPTSWIRASEAMENIVGGDRFVDNLSKIEPYPN